MTGARSSANLSRSPAALAFVGLAVAVLITLMILPFNFAYVWPGSVAAGAVVYAWAALAAALSLRYARFAVWLLVVGTLPLTMWGLWVFLGAADFIPLIAIWFCWWSVVRALRLRTATTILPSS